MRGSNHGASFILPGLAVSFLLNEIWASISGQVCDNIDDLFAHTMFVNGTRFTIRDAHPSLNSLLIRGFLHVVWTLVYVLVRESNATVQVRMATQALAPLPEQAGGDNDLETSDPSTNQSPAPRTLVYLHPCEVIAGRPHLPYNGFGDCMVKLYKEDGCTSLIRGAAYTTLLVVFSHVSELYR